MRGLFLSFSHSSQIVVVGLLLLSTHLLWAQRTSPLEKIPIQLLDTPGPFARVSDTQTLLHLTYRRLPPNFEQNRGQTESRMRFSPPYPGYNRLPINTNGALYPATRTTELRGKEKSFIGSVSSKWLTFAPTYGRISHDTTYRVEDLERYGSHIPWTGSIILRICQTAKAHPHITRVLTVLQPQF